MGYRLVPRAVARGGGDGGPFSRKESHIVPGDSYRGSDFNHPITSSLYRKLSVISSATGALFWK